MTVFTFFLSVGFCKYLTNDTMVNSNELVTEPIAITLDTQTVSKTQMRC